MEACSETSGLSSGVAATILQLIRAIRKAFPVISDSYRSRAAPANDNERTPRGLLVAI